MIAAMKDCILFGVLCVDQDHTVGHQELSATLRQMLTHEVFLLPSLCCLVAVAVYNMLALTSAHLCLEHLTKLCCMLIFGGRKFDIERIRREGALRTLHTDSVTISQPKVSYSKMTNIHLLLTTRKMNGVL